VEQTFKYPYFISVIVSHALSKKSKKKENKKREKPSHSLLATTTLLLYVASCAARPFDARGNIPKC
jgi:hypothetical protein